MFEHLYDGPVSLPPVFLGKPCWVRPPDCTAGEVPGIVIEWRKEDAGYEGHVVWAMPGYGAATVRQGWLPADRIRKS